MGYMHGTLQYTHLWLPSSSLRTFLSFISIFRLIFFFLCIYLCLSVSMILSRYFLDMAIKPDKRH